MTNDERNEMGNVRTLALRLLEAQAAKLLNPSTREGGDWVSPIAQALVAAFFYDVAACQDWDAATARAAACAATYGGAIEAQVLVVVGAVPGAA